MAYPPQYIAMVVGAVRTLVGAENMHLRDAIARVARQMSLDAALVDSWVKQSPEYTAREDAPGAARRSGTSANKRSAEHEQGGGAQQRRGRIMTGQDREDRQRGLAAATGRFFWDRMMRAFVEEIRELAAHVGPERTLVSRWLPTADRTTSWGEYFRAWPFADVPATDPLYDLVDGAAELTAHPTIDEPTFGKWTAGLRRVIGEQPRFALAGVATDCCVISTALPAADEGATVVVAADACAGSTQDNHEAALQVMALYSPQIEVATSAAVLSSR